MKNNDFFVTITFYTDDDFFLVSPLLNGEQVFISKTFDNKQKAIDFVHSLQVKKLKENHFEHATEFLESFKKLATESIKNNEMINYYGNWEYSIKFNT